MQKNGFKKFGVKILCPIQQTVYCRIILLEYFVKSSQACYSMLT